MHALSTRRARARLWLDRWLPRWRGGTGDRVLSTICWSFPIYSQTFVYEELVQMMHGGFDVRLLYGELAGRDQLPAAYDALWELKRATRLDPAASDPDIAYFRRRMPARVQALVDRVSTASGLAPDRLWANEHMRMAFSYARLVEAFRPAYLHSYFFYEGTFFTFVASQLLRIPRGVSCYADHMLSDFPLKLVPLHLETCSVVVATSERIAQELDAMHPQRGMNNVLVKPNAIDSARFPERMRQEPAHDSVFRLICVSRLEPKKGLLDLVEAVALLVARGQRLEVVVVGSHADSPEGRAYVEALRQRIASHGLESTLALVGRQSPDEVRRRLHASHVFVAPFVETANGDKDGIPTALLEAMATAAPIVATDAGSITEPLRDGVNGVIVPQGQPEALANAIAALLSDPMRRAQLGAAAAQTVRDSYDVRVCDALLHTRMRAAIAAREDSWS